MHADADAPAVAREPRRRAWLMPLALLALCVLTWFLKDWVQAPRTVSGHGDIAQRYTLARNLAAGRGLFLDYVPTWLGQVDELRVSGAGYWMPFPSWIGALGILATGDDSFPAAQSAMILLSSLLPALVYLLAREVLRTRGEALLAAALSAVFHAFLFRGAQLGTLGPTAMLSCLAFLGVLRAYRDPRWLALVGVAAGLAHANRSDGALWLPVAVLALWFARPERVRPRDLALLAGSYALALAPLLYASWSTQGTLMPQGQWRVALLTSYPELYSLPSRLDWDHYASRGMGVIVGEKWGSVLENLTTTGTSLATGDGLRSWDALQGGTPYAWLALCWIGTLFLPRRFLLVAGLRLAADLALYGLLFTHTGKTSFGAVQYILFPLWMCGGARALGMAWRAAAGRGGGAADATAALDPAAASAAPDPAAARAAPDPAAARAAPDPAAARAAPDPAAAIAPDPAPARPTVRGVLATACVLGVVAWLGVGGAQQARRFAAQRGDSDRKAYELHRAIRAELLDPLGRDDAAYFVGQTSVHSFHANTGTTVASLPFRAHEDEVLAIAERLGVDYVMLGRRDLRSEAWPELGPMLNGANFREVAARRFPPHGEFVVWEIAPR